jgi:hypothetical protein
MIRNVDFPEVKHVGVAIIPETDELNKTNWFVYIVNTGKEAIQSLMVTSRGFGHKKGKEVKTSTLRRFLGDVPAEGSIKVEPIPEELFGLNNEYWVSFQQNNQMFDKKYLFTSGAISEKHLTVVPVLGEKGVWHP